MSHLTKTLAICMVALLLPAVSASAGSPAASASADSPEASASRNCSTSGRERRLGVYPGYVTALSTRRVSCADARSFSKLFHRCRGRRGGRDGTCPRVRRFRCSERRFNRNYVRGRLISFDSRVLCVRGSQRIRQTYQQLVRI